MLKEVRFLRKQSRIGHEDAWTLFRLLELKMDKTEY